MVELMNENKWGVVCGYTRFGSAEAIVACRMLGIEYVYTTVY